MFKFKILIVFVLILLFFFPKTIFANTDYFETDIISDYYVDKMGFTNVKITLNIRNLKNEVYPKEYHLNMNGLYPEDIKVISPKNDVKFQMDKGFNFYYLKIFLDKSIGKNNISTIIVEFKEDNITKIHGNSMEITLPQIDYENYHNAEIYLHVDKNFSKEAYINPIPEKKIDDKDQFIYYFSKNNLLKSKVSALFGDTQSYDVNLKYFIKNSLPIPKIISIPIPPDTNYQTVNISNINPFPKNVLVDDDGNWMALYLLLPFQTKNIYYQSTITLYSTPISNIKNNISNYYTSPQKYWESDNEAVIKMAQNLTNTYDIYNFVTNNLTYNTDNIGSNNERKGAYNSLMNKNDALCSEFTDLFIALGRAKNIPVREIQGYAYVDNNIENPLSFYTDILHSWPQYWDSDKMNWYSVDPTWGNITKTNYFDNLDLKHITFVIHGKNSTSPENPLFYKKNESNIHVNISNKKPESKLDFRIDSKDKLVFNIFRKNLLFKIYNNGNMSIKDKEVSIIFNDKNESFKIEYLPPYGYITKEVSFIINPFKQNPKYINIHSDNLNYSYKINYLNGIVKQTLVYLLLISSIFIPIYLIVHNNISSSSD